MLAIFLDIETTGLDASRHHAIDIAFKVVDMSSGDIVGAFQQIIKPTFDEWAKADPISLQINGYSWQQLVEGRSREEVGADIVAFLTALNIVRGKAVFICQNPSFDRSFFAQLVPVYTQERYNWPYHWLDLASMYWAHLAKNGLPAELNLSKNEIAKRYGVPPEQDPHRAVRGVDHLIECYKKVVGYHPVLQPA